MTDIVHRLRVCPNLGYFEHDKLCQEAADEIERIEDATIERCAEAVGQFLTGRGYVGLAAGAITVIRASKDKP